MIISGKNSVFEALNSGKNISKILISKANHDDLFRKVISMCKDRHIRFDILERRVLDRLSPHSQGYIAYIEDFKYCNVSDILSMRHRKNNLIVILDNIQDPQNFGSIIRTCECLGVDGIIIPQRHSAMVNETVYRASAGAVSYVKIAKVTNIAETIKLLKKKDIWVYAMDSKGEVIFKEDLSRNIAIVIGSEGEGVRYLVKKMCDGILSLPMYGNINSLNASTATSAGIYEIIRQMEYGKENGRS